LNHDVDIPNNLAAGQAVNGSGQQERYRLAVLSCSLWRLYFLNQWTSAWHRLALFNSNTLLILWWLHGSALL